ncbi:hypothetical protein HI914_07198 [Erysiphe necator]|nr:hypothetical protein HI914_07198 [Erysiphe necator]
MAFTRLETVIDDVDIFSAFILGKPLSLLLPPLFHRHGFTGSSHETEAMLGEKTIVLELSRALSDHLSGHEIVCWVRPPDQLLGSGIYF